MRLSSGVADAEPVPERRCTPELEPKQGREDQRSPVAGEAVVQSPVPDLYGDLVTSIGRGNAHLALQWGRGYREYKKDRQLPTMEARKTRKLHGNYSRVVGACY
jgi:hypothetical protein